MHTLVRILVYLISIHNSKFIDAILNLLHGLIKKIFIPDEYTTSYILYIYKYVKRGMRVDGTYTRIYSIYHRKRYEDGGRDCQAWGTDSTIRISHRYMNHK